MRVHAGDDQILFADVGYTIARRNARDNFLAFFNQTKAGLDDARKMGASCDDAHALTRMASWAGKRPPIAPAPITHIFMKRYPFIGIVTLAKYRRLSNRFGSATSARRH